ncbi:hypothetical protein WDU94_010909 [Cyamophila willieti]
MVCNEEHVQSRGDSDNLIGAINALHSKEADQWEHVFKCNGYEIKFKLDTGSDFSIVTPGILNNINPNFLDKVKPCKIKAEAFGGQKLNIVGTIDMKMSFKENSKIIKFHVMLDNHGIIPILGKQACEELGIVKRIHQITQCSKENLVLKYSTVFEGIGKFPTEYEIKLEEGETPTVKPPRRVAYSLLPRLEETLNKLINQNIIAKVEQPVNWCSNLVLVEKPNGDLRICLDPIDLNKVIKREHYLIPTLEEIKSKLSGKKFFSVLDLKDGFYQVPLAQGSDDICTFSTPLGFYKFLRLPFGVKTAPEIFMKINSEAFKNIPNLIIYFDDILIATETEQEHHETLKALLEKALEINVKFNEQKFQFMNTKIKYLGHIFSEQGCELDPDRVEAISELKPPTNVKELRSMLGMINYVRDFIPNMSDLTAPLRELLKKQISWYWSDRQQQSFDKLKTLLSNAPVLRNFDCNLDVKIQTDASLEGLGCCLIQNGQPVAFASRSLTPTEKKLPIIELETVAIAFSCRKFHKYIWGKSVVVESDHLPLVSIFNKNLCDIASERIVKLRLDLMRYDLKITYLQGTKMFVADLLSRNYCKQDYDKEIKIEGYVHNIYGEPELLDLNLIKNEIKLDNDLSIVISHVHSGWPEKKTALPDNEVVKHYYNMRNDLKVLDDLLYYQDRTVIPTSLKQKALEALHTGHMGITKTNLRAQQLFYWINLNKDVESFINKCMVCQENRPAKPNETLLHHEQSYLPFETLALDIMTFNSNDYLVVIDQYSKWIDIFKLNSKKSSEIISKLKLLFSNFGIPKIIYSDGSPFNSFEIHSFAKSCNIDWRISSPHYPRSNGLAEKAVQISKDILTKAHSLKINYLDLLLEYRVTPIPALGKSPSEILMGRIVNTKVPINPVKLKPIDNLSKFHSEIKNKIEINREGYKNYHDKTARKETSFEINDNVLLHDKGKWTKGKIVGNTPYPRSYEVLKENGAVLRRNTKFLKHTPIEFKNSFHSTPHTANNYDEIWDLKCKLNDSLDIDHNMSVVASRSPSPDITIRHNENIPPSPGSSSGDSDSYRSIDNLPLSEEELLSPDERDTVNLDHDYLRKTKSGRVIKTPSKYK